MMACLIIKNIDLSHIHLDVEISLNMTWNCNFSSNATLVWLHCLSAPATTGNLWHLCGCWSNSQWSLLYQYLIFPTKFCFEITRMKWLVLDQIQILISAIPKLNSNFGIGLGVGEVVEKKTYFSSEIWLID